MRVDAVRATLTTMPRLRRLPIALAACALSAATLPVAVHAADPAALPDADRAAELCAPAKAGEQCGPGNGRRTSGGGAKVTHAGWPAVTGILWKVLDSRDHDKAGGAANDELLGHHGSDRIEGGAGKDIIWGDWDPSNNNGSQRDVLIGGAGDDFIYPSHGTTKVVAGSGRDFIWAYYGKGTIDCGPGQDTARVRMNGAFKLQRCEKVLHW
jgi:RTX calcium-binding nonapeptide repeat (4 copies)